MKSILLFLFVCFLNQTITGQSKNDGLLVFIGEKISISKERSASVTIEPTNRVIDNKDTVYAISITKNVYAAVYKVVKSICNNYTEDTISFSSVDEFGIPDFVNYQNVLLFLRKEEGRIVHLGYHFFDVYKTIDGKWASHYTKRNQFHPLSDDPEVQPEKINFKDDLFFNISNMTEERIEYHYPSPYYKIEGNKAIPVYGYYLDDLVKLTKQGILRYRGYGYPKEH